MRIYAVAQNRFDSEKNKLFFSLQPFDSKNVYKLPTLLKLLLKPTSCTPLRLQNFTVVKPSVLRLATKIIAC